MYFAYDPHHPDLADQVRQIILDTHQQTPGVSVYVLIDGCLDQDWGKNLYAYSQKTPSVVQPLYLDSPLEELEECAPFLCVLTPKELDSVLSRTSAKPMFNLILSPLTLSELRAHLLRFTRAQSEDSLYYPLRLADTAALPHIVEALSPAQQQLFFSGFVAWYIVNRGGKLQLIESPKTASPPEEAPHVDVDSFAIHESALIKLLGAGDADQLLCQLGNSNPGQVKGRNTEDLYKMSCFIVTQMKKLGIADSEQPVAYRQALRCSTEEEAGNLLKDIAANNQIERGLV